MYSRVSPGGAGSPAGQGRDEQEAKPEQHWWEKAADGVGDFVDEHDISWSDVGHTTLDVVGMVPVVGEVADGANAVWSLAEGDHTDAAISDAAMIPGLGMGVVGAKCATKGAKGALEIADDLAHSPAGDAVRRVGKTVADSAQETAAGLAGAARGLVDGRQVAVGASRATAGGASLPGTVLSVPARPAPPGVSRRPAWRPRPPTRPGRAVPSGAAVGSTPPRPYGPWRSEDMVSPQAQHQ